MGKIKKSVGSHQSIHHEDDLSVVSERIETPKRLYDVFCHQFEAFGNILQTRKQKFCSDDIKPFNCLVETFTAQVVAKIEND